jgi:hypothetical protein
MAQILQMPVNEYAAMQQQATYAPELGRATPQKQIPNPVQDPRLEQLAQYDMQHPNMYRASTGRPTFPVPAPPPVSDPFDERVVYDMQHPNMYRASTGRPTFPVPAPPPVFNPFAERIAEEYGQQKKNNKR